jgi:hypothetical protein
MYRLDNNPNAAAQALTDDDLYSALMVCSGGLYYAHCTESVDHVFSGWLLRSVSNYVWIYVMFCALLDEHKYRYETSDYADSYKHGRVELVKTPTHALNGPETPYPFFVDEKYIIGDDVVESYRNYYRAVNTDPAKWTRRDPPEWMHLTKS